jgi:hypothetical protein
VSRDPTKSLSSGENAGTRKEPSMNIFLWVLQVLLALLFLAGGGFKTFNPR